MKSEPNGNQFLPVPDFGSFKFKSVGKGKSSGDIVTALATTPPAAAAPKQKKGVAKAKAKGVAKPKAMKCFLNKALSKKKEKGAKHGEPGVELGQGGIMNEKLVYNRAYKRVRYAELKKGSTDETAKKRASEKARNAVKFFLDEGIDAW